MLMLSVEAAGAAGAPQSLVSPGRPENSLVVDVQLIGSNPLNQLMRYLKGFCSVEFVEALNVAMFVFLQSVLFSQVRIQQGSVPVMTCGRRKESHERHSLLYWSVSDQRCSDVRRSALNKQAVKPHPSRSSPVCLSSAWCSQGCCPAAIAGWLTWKPTAVLSV